MKTFFLSILSLSVLLFASCNNGEDIAPNVNDGRVHFSSGVSQSNARIGRASEDTWDGDEKIGIYMVATGGSQVVNEATNAQYQAKEAGTRTSFDPVTNGDIMYYPVDATQKVDFMAYYPYTTTISNYVYSVKTVDQNSQSGIDLMRAFANNGAKGFDKSFKSSVNLEFNHKLTKIVLNIHNGDGVEVEDLKNLEITFKGLDTEATYNIATDKLTHGDVIADIKAYTSADNKGKTYELTVVPQVVEKDDVIIEFKLNNSRDDIYTYPLSGRTFGEGKQHTYKVTIKRNEVIINGTIKPWDKEGEEEIIVE